MPTLAATWNPTTAAVELVAGSIAAGITSVRIDRYDTVTLTNPETVRGSELGGADPGPGFSLTDREFAPGVLNTYILRQYTAGVLTTSTTATVTPDLTGAWLRSPTRPFLDRAVTIVDFSAISLPARQGVFEVLGRRLPVALTEVRGSRRYDLTLTVATLAEADALELFLSFGDVLLVQVPPTCVVPRSMYAAVGDVTAFRRGKHDTARRYFTLPLVEVAAPDPSIAGATITWGGVVGAYATWSALVAAKASWSAVLSSISAPADEIVG